MDLLFRASHSGRSHREACAQHKGEVDESGKSGNLSLAATPTGSTVRTCNSLLCGVEYSAAT